MQEQVWRAIAEAEPVWLCLSLSWIWVPIQQLGACQAQAILFLIDAQEGVLQPCLRLRPSPPAAVGWS